MNHDLTQFSALRAAESIRAGRMTSEALVQACLARIGETEPVLRAWAHLDADLALEQAREMDRIRRSGHATGPLHGVPVGVKDIVDTRDMPTGQGSEIYAGNQPGLDAFLVERLREAGAVILGKTRTTEFAYLHPTDTTNPHDAAHTPGGSSSGSAAAVAARQVPLAVGTQTGGSVIRPASFCGVYGFKPTRGTISRTGVFRTSATLDQIGGFANTIEDVALLCDVLGGYDQTDQACFARPRPAMLAGARADAPHAPRLAWFDMPYHDRLSGDARAGLDAVIETLGGHVERCPVPPHLADLVQVHKTVYDYEIRQNMAAIHAAHADALSPEMRGAIERGGQISDAQYRDALAARAAAQAFFADHFNDFDAILSPSASGEALPLSDGSTGDAVHCTIWTLAGLPSLTLPLLTGANGLPIGVQLIGAAERDDRLMRTAAWLQGTLASAR